MPFEDQMRQALDAMFRAQLDFALGGGQHTCNRAAEETALRKLISDWHKILSNARRSQITFVVDRAHQGGPLRHQTPNDGERFELSWLDANRLHQEWPLRLHQVLSEDAAEFVPAPLGEFVPKHLPQPPFEMPAEETLEGWLRGDYKKPPPA
jgi:hypothetical protein